MYESREGRLLNVKAAGSLLLCFFEEEKSIAAGPPPLSKQSLKKHKRTSENKVQKADGALPSLLLGLEEDSDLNRRTWHNKVKTVEKELVFRKKIRRLWISYKLFFTT